ncbi:unnamed protein product [Parnassius apollo]|uniref:(apollo) hypothetical protein n=1 Tax=Parnassius apollo TaxID=110799 RepID=A0A8S3WJS3_PARAO|nr:unnamed protein product [Parnassius apollo]
MTEGYKITYFIVELLQKDCWRYLEDRKVVDTIACPEAITKYLAEIVLFTYLSIKIQKGFAQFVKRMVTSWKLEEI